MNHQLYMGHLQIRTTIVAQVQHLKVKIIHLIQFAVGKIKVRKPVQRETCRNAT